MSALKDLMKNQPNGAEKFHKNPKEVIGKSLQVNV